jgi:O-antigen ligase
MTLRSYSPPILRDQPPRKIGAIGIAWVALVSLVPIYRLVEVHFFARLDYVTFVLIALSLLFRRVSRPRYAELWVWSGLGVLAASALVGAQADYVNSIITGLQLSALLLFLPFIFAFHASRPTKWLTSCLVAFLLVQTASATVGIAQAALGMSPFGFAARQGRANGLAEHPNVLGLMCAIALLVLIYAMRYLRIRGRILALAAILLNGAALVFTGSLSSILAFAVGLVVLLPAARMTWRTAIATLAIGASAIPVLAATSTPGALGFDELIESRVQTVTGETSEEGSLEIRQQTWAAAWNHIQTNPFFGVGMDSTHQAVYGTTVTHNYLLHYWYRGGIILFAVALTITAVALVVAVRAMVKAEDAVPAAVIVTILTFAMTAAFFDQHGYWIPLLLAFACLGAAGQSHVAVAQPASDAASPIPKLR